MSEFSSTDHCHYIVPRKKRRCRMFTKVGKRFCGEHSHLLEENQGTFSWILEFMYFFSMLQRPHPVHILEGEIKEIQGCEAPLFVEIELRKCKSKYI